MGLNEVERASPGRRRMAMAGLVLAAGLFPAQRVHSAEPRDSAYVMPEVLVTAMRVPIEKNKIGSSVSVISAEDIVSRGVTDMGELIKYATPGMEIYRNGGIGQSMFIATRGASQNRHTLVMVDGIEINNPVTGVPEIRYMNTSAIERVEMIRGPQSTLYGGDATTGVINIITKKGATLKPNITGFMKLGSYETREGQMAISQGLEKFHYNFSYYTFVNNGLSSADGRPGAGGAPISVNQPDPVQNQTWQFTGGYRFQNGNKLDATWMKLRTDVQFDGFVGGIIAVDTDAAGNDVDEENYGLTYEGKVTDDLDYVVRGSHRSNDSDGNRDNSRVRTLGRRSNGELQMNYRLDEINLFTFGFERKEDFGARLRSATGTGLFRRQYHTNGYFFQHLIQSRDQKTAMSLGIRYDDSSHYGSKYTNRFTLSHQAGSKVRFHSSFGTGFSPPTINDLFNTTNGNLIQAPGETVPIVPEKSEGWDAGFEFQDVFKPGVQMGLTYFSQSIQNLIATVNSIKRNRDLAWSDGVEFEFTWPMSTRFLLRGNATWQTTNEGNGVPLDKRPQKKGGATLSYFPDATWQAHLHTIYVGARRDQFSTLAWLPPHTIFNLVVNWDVTSQYRVTARIENLLDKDYQQIASYSAPDLSGSIMFEYKMF